MIFPEASPVERFHRHQARQHWQDAQFGRPYFWLHLRRCIAHSIAACFC